MRPAARLSVEHLEDRSLPAALNVVLAADGPRPGDAAALAAPFADRVEHLGFGIYHVRLSAGTSVAAAAAHYAARPGVVSAAEDAVIRVERVSNDPRYGSLYGMYQVGAPAAWNLTTGNPNFVVAVIDTGIDYRHPDLAANIWRNPGEVEGNGVDDDRNGYVDDVFGWDFANNDNDPFDDNGHGTHVAGTIGAVGDNGVGVAGVNWAVDLMALKFLRANGSGSTSAAVRALDYAVRMGVRVSNNSWGGAGADPSLAAALGRARAAGHIFVAAAGNSGQNIDTSPAYPASYGTLSDNVVTVAATDGADRLASFSNFGRLGVTLAAPGVGILSTTPGNTYSSYSGTSMAAPHVAGAIALYWGRNPGLTYAQVIDHLKASVDPVAGLTGVVQTGGRLNVGRLLQTPAAAPAAADPAPAAVSPPVTPPAPPVPVSGTFAVAGLGRAVRDGRTTASTITVPHPIRVADLNVRVVLAHTRTSDLVIRLRGPDGTAVVLFARRGGNGDHLSGTVFDDEARRPVGSAPAPFAGGFRPDGRLSAFDGKLAAGTWTLEVTDVRGGDVGVLRAWSLAVSGTVEAAGAAAPTSVQVWLAPPPIRLPGRVADPPAAPAVVPLTDPIAVG